MARGKQTCRILKDIRRQIAEANGIDLMVSECQYKGDCTGTCPKCESELRYLEQQLRLRRMMGKAVVIAGISAGMAALSGCSDRAAAAHAVSNSNTQNAIDDLKTNTSDERCMLFIDSPTEASDTIILSGEVPWSERDVDTIPDPTRVYIIPDISPEFPGGQEGVMAFIKKNLRCTEEIEREGRKRVVIQFEVDAEGHVCNPNVIRSKGKASDAEAIRVVNLLPDFKPGMKSGQPVRSLYTVPIDFGVCEENK